MAMGEGGKDGWKKLVPSDEIPFLSDFGDGIDQWAFLSTDSELSKRTELLHSTQPQGHESSHLGSALTVGDMKIIKQNFNPKHELEDGWFPPPGQDPNMTNYTISNCGHDALPNASSSRCNEKFCLFNVTAGRVSFHFLLYIVDIALFGLKRCNCCCHHQIHANIVTSPHRGQTS